MDALLAFALMLLGVALAALVLSLFLHLFDRKR